MMVGGTLWHYLGSFIFYTLLSIGVLYLAYFYLKKNPALMTFSKNQIQSQQGLEIESKLPLEARKNLYVIRSGKERFLIATSLEGTQFLARLEGDIPQVETLETVEPLAARASEMVKDENLIQELSDSQKLARYSLQMRERIFNPSMAMLQKTFTIPKLKREV